MIVTVARSGSVILPMFTSTFSCAILVIVMRLIVLGPGRHGEGKGYNPWLESRTVGTMG